MKYVAIYAIVSAFIAVYALSIHPHPKMPEFNKAPIAAWIGTSLIIGTILSVIYWSIKTLLS